MSIWVFKAGFTSVSEFQSDRTNRGNSFLLRSRCVSPSWESAVVRAGYSNGGLAVQGRSTTWFTFTIWWSLLRVTRP